MNRLVGESESAMTPDCPARLRVQFRRVRVILANVRWGYGPPENVEVIGPTDDPPPT